MNRVVSNQEDQPISLLPALAIPARFTIAASSLALALPARQDQLDSGALDSVSTTPSWKRFEWSPLDFSRTVANDLALLLSDPKATKELDQQVIFQCSTWSALLTASPRRMAKRELKNTSLGNVTFFGRGATFVLLVSMMT